MVSESDGMNIQDIVIDECLCWIINKHNVLDPETWMRLCSDTFEEAEIEASKNLLLSLLSDVSKNDAFKKRRNRGDKFDSKNMKNLRDILCLLLEKGESPMPKIAALDLGKLPPIGFNNIDVSVLFNRIQNGNITIKLLKDTISTLSESNDDMCKMIRDLDQRMKKLEISKPSDKFDEVIVLEKPNVSELSDEDDIDDCEKLIDKLMEEMPFSCSDCDFKFMSNVELIGHRVTHESIDKDLSAHILSHKTHNCDSKGNDFNSSSEDTMKIHKENHTGEEPHKGNICNTVDNNDLQNMKPNESEIIALPFKCTECKSSFRDETERESHILSKHNFNFECPTCEFKSFTGHGLMEHMKAHETVNRLVSDSDLRSHATKHTGKKPYECESCGLICKTESELKSHLDITHAIHCEQCSFRCDTYDMLTMHMRRHSVRISAEYTDERPIERPFSCMQCGYKCKDKRVLEHHITLSHNFLCNKCEYKCTGEDILRDHMELHLKLNGFKCTECDYKCTSEKLLVAHMANHKKSAGNNNHKNSSGYNNHRRQSRQGSTTRKGSTSNTNVWDKLSLNDLARQHFIDTLAGTDGFSAPFKNGKPIRQKEVMANKSSENTPTNYRNRSGVVGTAIDSNISIAEDRRLGKVFATRYGPDVDITSVKSNLENKLKETTGVEHTVNVESVKTRFNSYSSFKITCLCSDINVLYNPSIWPKGCFVKRWIDPRGNRGGITGTSNQ